MYGVVDEALALPIKIVVMRDDGVTSFGDELSDGKPKRQIDWNGDRVLDDEQFKFVALGKFVEMLFYVIL